MNNKLIIGMSLAVVMGTAVAEELRNPFVSQGTAVVKTVTAVSEPEKQQVYLPPLQREPLQSYRLLGVAVSEEHRLAVIADRLGGQHIVQIGDRIGLDQARISEIEDSAIQLSSDQGLYRMALGVVAERLKGEER